MKYINKALVYVVGLVLFCLLWFGWACPWIMTIPDNVMAIIGAAMYVVGVVVVIYGTIRFWKKELRLLKDLIKENLL